MGGHCLHPSLVGSKLVTPVLIRGTMKAQRYVHDILQRHVLPLMQRLPGAIFQQDNAWPPRQGSLPLHCCTVTPHALLLPFFALPDPQISLHLSISGIIWDGELGIPRV
ncbi:uncharacterized protein TNCV_2403671 [Trichonephila clavipes]|uniref:Uncharacterized protein n=1 Tax=Trichonephila clavipes TaxID=2585209 RepID=A0A8X6UNJ7_TRICX|nr:uncharacterized protein TNCV_2403671 [Trichonephila clavipes]